MRATTIPATPAHCKIRSRIRDPSVHYCMVVPQLLAPVNTVVYGGLSQGTRHDRPTLRQRLARPGPESAGPQLLHRASGPAPGEGDGGVAPQFLLAFRRHRRV